MKLVYENRGEKLGIARLDLNDRIARRSSRRNSIPTRGVTREAARQGLRGHHSRRALDKIAADFVEHCATGGSRARSMLVCIDKITCARMYQRIMPRWQAKAAAGSGRWRGQASGRLSDCDETERAALA